MKLFALIVRTIIISIIFDQASITAEARKLRKTTGQDHFKDGSTYEFVPTSPGNSPGMVHKRGNANVEGFQDDVKSPEGRKVHKTSGQDLFKTGVTDDFAPTTPGNSPGIGHKKGHANVKEVKDTFKLTQGRMQQKTKSQYHFKTGLTDDFAPTSPGHSPGMGHKKGSANAEGLRDDFDLTEERKSPKMDGHDHFKTGTTEDFAPTTPGNSPGMGHKKGDDFKPTTPGHSPGVGHAVKNAEPKT
ncbi:Precursor of CEP9 [Hirschfeldia incana]|nr:Precursor of CEP9 [Hirschfeldia incana]